MTPVSIPCSRNTHVQNVLVQRPQWDQHERHSMREKRSSLEEACKGRLDDLLCSCNARSQKTLVGHAQRETI